MTPAWLRPGNPLISIAKAIKRNVNSDIKKKTTIEKACPRYGSVTPDAVWSRSVA
jgi:hypothetical protein